MEIWRKRMLATPTDFESAWKFARTAYWLGGRGSEDARRVALDEGVEAGTIASQLQPMRPEGYFWMAANMGALAESFGTRVGLRYRAPIREALETVLRLDPAYQGGSADRALGRWYFRVPRLFGGDKTKSEQHLRKSLTYAPNSTASLFFLAELLVDRDRTKEAIETLNALAAAPVDPDWAPEDQEFKQKGQELLKSIQR